MDWFGWLMVGLAFMVSIVMIAIGQGLGVFKSATQTPDPAEPEEDNVRWLTHHSLGDI